MTDNPTVETLLQQGHRQLERGQDQAALETFQQAVQLEVQNPQVLYGLGLAYFRLEQYQESIEYLNQALDNQPSYILALARRGMAYRQLNMNEQATADFEKAIQIEPQDHEDWRGRGITFFEKAIQIKPQDHEDWESRGITLDELQLYQEALSSHNKAIEIRSDYCDAWISRGLVLRNLRRYEEAISSHDKAIEIHPHSYLAWCYRGIPLVHLGRYEEAVANFDKAIEIKSDYYFAWYKRGLTLVHLGRYEEAVANFDKAIEIKPDYYSAWCDRGGALYKLGEYHEVIACCDKAIEIKPDYYIALSNRGTVLLNLERYQEAIMSFNEALKIHPNDNYSKRHKAAVLNNLRLFPEALAICTEVLENRPNDYHAWYVRGFALNGLRQYLEALASYDKSLEFKVDDYSIWRDRGWTLFNLERYEEAFHNWDDGRQYFNLDIPNHREGRGELYYNEGKAYYQRGQKESNPFDKWFKAKQSYEAAFYLFDSPKCRKKQLEVLQDLIRICQYISTPKKVQELLHQGTDLLERWLQDSNFTDEDYIRFKQKFAGFYQYQVDTLAQSSEPEQQIQALELAEERKNTCLGWLQYGKNYKASSLNYEQIQRLLNSGTAAIYWHVSPAAITTFILKHNQPPHILHLQPSKANKKRPPFPFFSQPEKPYPTAAYQLREFETWLSEWKRDYQNYCQAAVTNNTLATKAAMPWRQKMESQLRRLESILHISDILPCLQNIDHLILIPHRDLHLLPLHYLFPSRFIITYLPSFQIGLNLQPHESTQSLLNLENPRDDLLCSTLASEAISALYPQCQMLDISTLDKSNLLQALKSNTGTFQFMGHAYHDLTYPQKSALVLTHSYKLTMADIFEQLDFGNYNLIFLSACETGITSSHNLIDEYVGLVSAFLAKGASYVISTLWTVDERSSALLTIRFYQYLKAGETPVSALKQAQTWLHQLTYPQLAKWYLDLARDIKAGNPHCSAYLNTEAQLIQNDSDKMMAVTPPFEHPYYWAGFIVTGNPPL